MRKNLIILFVLSLLSLSGLACSLSDLVTRLEEPTPYVQPAAPTPIVVVVTPTPLPPELVTQADVEEQIVINVYAQVSGAVVCITAEEAFGSCVGSGFVIDKEGYVVTNNHVVQETPRPLVTLADEHTVPAEIIGTDAGSDLAVLKIDVPPEQLVVVELGDSSSLRVG